MDDTEVELSVLVKRGETGTTALAENVEALPRERYRVEKYLIADPADVDGDCIDDITELDDFGSKNPVNAASSIDLRDGAVGIADTRFSGGTLQKTSYKSTVRGLVRRRADSGNVRGPRPGLPAPQQ